MSKHAGIVALIALGALGVLNSIGMYWFVYGMWPRSWWAFALFSATTPVLSAAISVVNKKD